MEVHASEHRLRVDRYLKKRLAEVGRGRILEWLRGGGVRVNGRPLSGENYFVKRGDRVEWPGGEGAGSAPAGMAPAVEAAAPVLSVLYEDPDLIVVNKPGGVPTNPSPAAGRWNVVALLERTVGRLHLVHRLDRDTSGALVLTRNPRARDRLLAAFRNRQVEKTYLAVVAGSVRPPVGTLRTRLLAHPRRSTRRVATVRRGGVEARTDYRVAERLSGATRHEVRALTGRMHQIRAQLAGIGHPILGDRIYGRPHSSRPPCLCLHARSLTLPHPRSGEALTVEAPLPTRLAEFLERLRGGPRAERRQRRGAWSRTPRLWMILLAVLLAGAHSGDAFAKDSLPIPVEKSICYKPEIHDGIYGHMLFLYVVSSVGRVENVRPFYVEITPKEREAKLIGHLRHCVEGWQYKPGMRGGKTVSMGLMTPFHFFRPAPPEDPQVPIPGGTTIGQSRLDEMREAKHRLVDHLLSGRQYSESRGPEWILKSDLGAKDVATVKRALEIATRTFDRVFPGLPPVEESRPVTIVAFRDNVQQDQVAAFDNLIPDREATAGLYSELDRMMYTAKGPKPTEKVIDIVVHEMTHHLIEERLYPGERSAPLWVHEGIASFLECLEYGRKEIPDLAKVEKTRVAGGGFLLKRHAEYLLEELRNNQKNGTLPSLEALLKGRLNRGFAQTNAETYYSISWLLVHYLINGEAGKYRTPFQAWMTRSAADPDTPSLVESLGVQIPELEAALSIYLTTIA